MIQVYLQSQSEKHYSLQFNLLSERGTNMISLFFNAAPNWNCHYHSYQMKVLIKKNKNVYG